MNEKDWFWFVIGCHVLYSYLYEDETLSISHELVKELHKKLVAEVEIHPEFANSLYQEFPDLYKNLSYMLSSNHS